VFNQVVLSTWSLVNIGLCLFVLITRLRWHEGVWKLGVFISLTELVANLFRLAFSLLLNSHTIKAFLWIILFSVSVPFTLVSILILTLWFHAVVTAVSIKVQISQLNMKRFYPIAALLLLTEVIVDCLIGSSINETLTVPYNLAFNFTLVCYAVMAISMSIFQFVTCTMVHKRLNNMQRRTRKIRTLASNFFYVAIALAVITLTICGIFFMQTSPQGHLSLYLLLYGGLNAASTLLLSCFIDKSMIHCDHKSFPKKGTEPGTGPGPGPGPGTGTETGTEMSVNVGTVKDVEVETVKSVEVGTIPAS